VLEEELSHQELLSTDGRPQIYHDLVDRKFLEWLSNEETPTIEKTRANMTEVYRKLHCEVLRSDEADALNDRGIRRHLFDLLKENCYKMRTPQVVDAKRCIKLNVLHAWYR